MLELVTIDEVAAQLRVDNADPWLPIWIPIVSQAVASWLKDSWRLYMPELDADGKVVVDSSGFPIPAEDSSGLILNPAVRGAVLVELASQYRFREGASDRAASDNSVPADAGYGYVLSKGATALLAPIRKTTVA